MTYYNYKRDDEWVKKHSGYFFPTKGFNEETGVAEDFLVSYCFNCKYPELSVLNMAEWLHKQNRLLIKVTGVDPVDQ